MVSWIPIESESILETISQRSVTLPCMIFKHSSRCVNSEMAMLRIEQGWTLNDGQLDAYFLDILKFPRISPLISKKFDVFHSSPQLLLIKEGECTFEAEGNEIDMPLLLEALDH